jgi:hypothetical protein
MDARAYMLPEQRKQEIENIVHNVILDYYQEGFDGWLGNYMRSLDVYKVFSHRAFPPKGMAASFSDKFVIVVQEGLPNLDEVVAHEFGHIQLGHLAEKKKHAKLSGYALWERMNLTKDIDVIKDTPLEKSEADYFSTLWRNRLSGINWLDGLEIIPLDRPDAADS